MRAQIQARVFEPGGGRATRTEKTLPVRTRNIYLGIRPTFEGRYSREGTETQFDIVAVDAAGKQVARPAVEYRIERTDWNYQWYEVDGRWRWHSIANDRLITADTVALKADEPTRLTFTLSWGSHRLTVVDGENNTSSTTQFYVGWYGGSDNGEETPDTLRVASDKENYAPGETARVRIEAPFAGEALLAIATDRIVSTRNVQVPAGGTTVDVPVSADWGAGAYALVTAWRPLDKPADRTPTRAIGLAWLGLEPKLRTLAIADRHAREDHAAPAHRSADQGRQRRARRRSSPWRRSMRASCSSRASARPIRPTITSASGGSASRCATTTAACSRPGRRSRPPAGRRRRRRHRRPRHRADAHRGAVQRTGEARRQGRGQDRARGPRLHRPAPADGGGLAKSRVGSADKRLYVRDAVSADVVLPRFLAPNDRGRLALSLHNIDGQAGDYRLTVQATGAVVARRRSPRRGGSPPASASC